MWNDLNKFISLRTLLFTEKLRKEDAHQEILHKRQWKGYKWFKAFSCETWIYL